MQLKSLMLGDCYHYVSPYMLGVARACERLGIAHQEVSIRSPLGVLARVIAEQRPDILWTHMLLWAPPGSPPTAELVSLMELAARAGTKVLLHDGDYKEATRHPVDLSSFCSLALCNHQHDRSAWKVPVVTWPYFAFCQGQILEPDPRWTCPLFFAGQVGADAVYSERTAFLQALKQRGVGLRTPAPADGNTLLQTDAIAASAEAVLGFGRPAVKGWLDTRVFQYPGAGGILVHDDVGGHLEPWVHYVPYESGSPDSVLEALGRLGALSPSERRRLREQAFAYVQAHHSGTARVRQVLQLLFPGRTL